MEDVEIKGKKDTTHDFYAFKRWLYLVLGLADIKSIPYYPFIALIYTVHFFIESMAIVAIYLVYPNKEKMIECLHTFILGLYSFWILTARLLCSESVRKAREIIKGGIYVYEGEQTDEAELKMKEEAVDEIKKKSDTLALMLLGTAISSIAVLPLSQFVFLDKNRDQDIEKILNPYLPNPIYMPFDTYTLKGYAASMLLNIQLILFTFGNATCINQAYLSCVLQLKVELQVLTHSLRNIEKRALLLLGRSRHHQGEKMQMLFYTDKRFQLCLYACLKANVLHHQALLRFQKAFLPFIGTCLLASAVLASLSYATSLFLILQNPAPNRMVVLVLTLFVEQCYNYFLCFVGQGILDESKTLHCSLFYIPWYYCDKRFNRLLDIMMCFTLNPIKIKTVLFNITASVQTHGDVMSTMYKIMNLLRQ